jgi:hypothetical protein
LERPFGSNAQNFGWKSQDRAGPAVLRSNQKYKSYLCESELRRGQLLKLLRKLTQRSEAKTPYAFSDEVLNGFKNKFGKFYGTDHLVSEGWLSYQASMQPQSDDGVRLCFHSGAMAMFETMQDIYSEAGDIGRAREKIEEGKPDKLWEGFRNCLADEIDAELLHQYKVAFHGGCWFINVVCFTWDEQQSLGTLASLRDEISEFKTDLKQWTIRVSVDDLVEALVRQAITMNWKQVHEIKRDNVAADSYAQAMVSLRFERGNEEAVVWRKDATVTLVRNYAPRTFDGFDELEQWLAKNPKNNDDAK